MKLSVWSSQKASVLEQSQYLKILKDKAYSYSLLSTTRHRCQQTRGIALDWNISTDWLYYFLRRHSPTCAATTHLERRSQSSIVAFSVVEETTSQLSESGKLGEEQIREYKVTSNDWTRVKNSLYREFFLPVGQQLSVGTFLGLATGYSLRRIGRFALFLLGTELLVLQLMSYKGWITIHWNRLSRDFIPIFDKSAAESILDILLYKMPFASAFCIGLKLAP